MESDSSCWYLFLVSTPSSKLFRTTCSFRTEASYRNYWLYVKYTLAKELCVFFEGILQTHVVWLSWSTSYFFPTVFTSQCTQKADSTSNDTCVCVCVLFLRCDKWGCVHHKPSYHKIQTCPSKNVTCFFSWSIEKMRLTISQEWAGVSKILLACWGGIPWPTLVTFFLAHVSTLTTHNSGVHPQALGALVALTQRCPSAQLQTTIDSFIGWLLEAFTVRMEQNRPLHQHLREWQL